MSNILSECPKCKTIQSYKYHETCVNCGEILTYKDRISYEASLALKLVEKDKSHDET